MLNVVELTKSYDEHLVLNDISFDVNDGSIFGVVGINGVGKSTLMRCLAGLYNTDKGYALLDKRSVYLSNEARKDILFVPDEIVLDYNGNIQSLKSFYESFYAFDNDNYNRYLKLFNLDDQEKFGNFSKGMRRQAMIVMALAIKPKLLLLDEAFDGLDPLARDITRKAIAQLVGENKSIVIISSHNLREIDDICDEYVMLENGKILSKGNIVDQTELISKYQLVFENEVTQDDLKELDILQYNRSGRVITLIVKGDKEKNLEILNKYKPLVCDEVGVDFEELFVYETQKKRGQYEQGINSKTDQKI